jgi:ribosomal-protein-alanine N-acetyltransferase
MTPPSEPHVVPATLEHLSTLRQIAAECGLTVDFEAELRKSYALLLVASLQGRPCGFLLAWRAADELHLTDLGVAAEHRRRGAARSLVHALVEDARRSGAAVILLEVRASNLPALCLYRDEGFSEVGRRARYYSDNDEDAVVMRRELG